MSVVRDLVSARFNQDVHRLAFDYPRTRLALGSKLDLHTLVTVSNVIVFSLAELLDQKLHWSCDQRLDTEANKFFRRVLTLRNVMTCIAPVRSSRVCVRLLVTAIYTTEPSRVCRLFDIPSLIVALRGSIPYDTAANSIFHERRLIEDNRMRFLALWTKRVPLLLVTSAVAHVLDVTSFNVHDRSLAHVINLGTSYLLKLTHASNGMTVNVLPAR